jgi:hypothetical protein
MKLSIATIALLGSASACGDRHAHHMKKWLGIIPKHETCPNRDTSTDMDNFEFHRVMHREVHNEFIRGWYKDGRKDVTGDKCWGAWMDADKDHFNALFDKAHKGLIWDISHQEIKNAVDEMMDFFFVNLDECAYYHMIYDTYNWCMENPMICMKKKGIMDRIVDNAIPLAGQAINAWTVFTADSMCYSDEEIISEVTSLVHTWADMHSTIIGFEAKWEPEDKTYEKLTFKEMHHNLRELHHSLPHGKCPVLAWFEQFMPAMPTYALSHSEGMHHSPFDMFAMPAMPMPNMDMFKFMMPAMHAPKEHHQAPFAFPMPDFSQFKLF